VDDQWCLDLFPWKSRCFLSISEGSLKRLRSLSRREMHHNKEHW
jgi:hypothetical protein